MKWFNFYKILYILSLAGCATAFKAATAQEPLPQRISAQLSALATAQNDTNKVILLNSLSFSYSDISPDSGIIFGKLALSLADSLNWKRGMAIAHSNLGTNFRSRADYADALDCYFKALKFNDELGNKHGIATCYENLGSIYENRGDTAKALGYYFGALKINRETNNKKGIAINLIAIGNMYESRDDYGNALLFLQQALAINEQLGYNKGVATTLANIGAVYCSQHKYAEALAFDFKALRIERTLGNKIGEAVDLGNIGETYVYIAAFSKGQIRPDSLVLSNWNANLKRGIGYLNESIAMCNTIGYLKGTIKFSKTLSKAYKFSGDNAAALAAYMVYANTKDSVFSTESSRKLKQIENSHDKELKNKDIEILKLRQNYEQERKQKERGYFLAGMLVLVLIIFFVIRERKKSEKLLLNILPQKIADRLKQKEHPIADHFESVSIMFIDMSGFTKYAQNRNPGDIVNTLNNVFTHFDALADKHGLEKIKTIGDCYMAVAGLPEPRKDHAAASVAMAMEVKETMKGYVAEDGTLIHFRIGLDCGPVVAGVIGKKKFTYDIWGDAVNTASRMESTGKEGFIHCTDNFKNEVEANPFEKGKNVLFTSRGMIEVKSKGHMHTWFIE